MPPKSPFGRKSGSMSTVFTKTGPRTGGDDFTGKTLPPTEIISDKERIERFDDKIAKSQAEKETILKQSQAAIRAAIPKGFK